MLHRIFRNQLLQFYINIETQEDYDKVVKMIWSNNIDYYTSLKSDEFNKYGGGLYRITKATTDNFNSIKKVIPTVLSVSQLYEESEKALPIFENLEVFERVKSSFSRNIEDYKFGLVDTALVRETLDEYEKNCKLMRDFLEIFNK